MFQSTTEEAAKDVAAFVSIFFATFGLKGRPFHLSGESYGVMSSFTSSTDKLTNKLSRDDISHYSHLLSMIKIANL